jgi:hypothetical protein
VAPPVPTTIDVVVRVSPAAALIAIDGRPSLANPFRGRLIRDGEIHHVSASAEGYESKVEEVTFSGDLAVDVSLDRLPPVVARSAPRGTWSQTAATARQAKTAAADGSRAGSLPPAAEITAPAPATAPGRLEADPASSRAPLRPIVTSNPYGAP